VVERVYSVWVAIAAGNRVQQRIDRYRAIGVFTRGRIDAVGYDAADEDLARQILRLSRVILEFGDCFLGNVPIQEPLGKEVVAVVFRKEFVTLVGLELFAHGIDTPDTELLATCDSPDVRTETCGRVEYRSCRRFADWR
jgi:hypothetical protein